MVSEKRNTLVVFDVGGVLVKTNFIRFYRRCSEISGQSSEEFQKAYVAMHLEPLRGRISVSEHLKRFGKLLGKRMHEKEIRELLGSYLAGQIDEVVALKCSAYEKGYAVGLFSNCEEVIEELITERYPEALEVYDPSFPKIYSFQTGLLKSEPEAYEQIRGFQKVVFIDDKTKYLKAGVEQGWDCIWFTPFIDRAESTRALHPEEEFKHQRFRRADSVKELKRALGYFGVNV